LCLPSLSPCAITGLIRHAIAGGFTPAMMRPSGFARQTDPWGADPSAKGQRGLIGKFDRRFKVPAPAATCRLLPSLRSSGTSNAMAAWPVSDRPRSARRHRNPAAFRRLQCAHGGRPRPPRRRSNADDVDGSRSRHLSARVWKETSHKRRSHPSWKLAPLAWIWRRTFFRSMEWTRRAGSSSAGRSGALRFCRFLRSCHRALWALKPVARRITGPVSFCLWDMMYV
jgi:hypothetical protein